MRAGKISFIISSQLFFILTMSVVALGQERQSVNPLEGRSISNAAQPVAQAQFEFQGNKEPVTIRFKRGHTLSAYLLKADAESITIEVKGKTRRVNLETVTAIVQQARLFDKYGNVGFDDEKARLDNYAIALQQEPSSQGYIIVFGRRGRAAEAKKRADRAKGYLTELRGINWQRLGSIDHCVRAQLEFELWLVPSGAAAPSPCASNSKRHQAFSKKSGGKPY